MSKTFYLPEYITGRQSDLDLASQMIQAWRIAGIFQVATNIIQDSKLKNAFEASKKFFQMPLDFKSQCINDLSYSGYIANGEELTAGKCDYSEIFTICKDIPLDHDCIQAHWPCHGSVPWPNENYHQSMKALMDELGIMGEKLLKLIALGLGINDINTFTKLTRNGWHHMRVLRFPPISEISIRGIGAHTDYGLLVIAVQDDIGGLYVRPPVEGENRNRNWMSDESSAGMYENDEPWIFVKPMPSVVTVFPGDILQLMTNGYLLSTPHQVRLNTKERFAMAYFHEPNFNTCVGSVFTPSSHEYIHYGTHFTNMFMRCYPNRITTRRIHKEDRLSVLELLRNEALNRLTMNKNTKVLQK